MDNFDTLLAEQAKVAGEIETTTASIIEACLARDAALDAREDKLAGDDDAGAATAAATVSREAERAQVERARLNGLQRRAAALEQDLPRAAVEAAVAVLAGLDAAVISTRQRLSEPNVTEADCTAYAQATIAAYSCAAALRDATGSPAYTRSLDARGTIERLGFGSISPPWLRQPGTRPKLAEDWRRLDPYLIKFRDARKVAERKAVRDGQARHQAAAARAGDDFGPAA